MKFEPGANSEFPTVPNGTYTLTVKAAEEKTSSSGNDMIALRHIVLDPETGEEVIVYDNLVCHPNALFRIRQFCTSAGLEDKLEEGELKALDCEGKEVQAELVIEESEQFGTRNVIKKYVGSPYSRVA